MGLLDFLKKQELSTIEVLKLDIERQRNEHFEEIAKMQSQLAKYSLITDIEKEFLKKQDELSKMISTNNDEINLQFNKIKELNIEYKSALETYKRLKAEVGLFESKLDLIEFGVYEPVYDFEKSDDYRQEQNRVLTYQKEMLQADTAAICTTQWTVQGSEAKGKAVVRVYKKLMLRAFNGESDVLIAKVKWNNVIQMKERMYKIFEAINRLGEGFQVHLNSKYLELKEKELILEYEYQAKKQKEKEEMKAIQDELREEEKARRDFEKAEREAEKEEAVYQKALEKVRKELGNSSGQDSDKLKAQIAQLEQDLKESQEKKQRALSMAQQTKRGHVYIISNIGAFGDNVYKIGMTRRLEPIDRIRELGDASVPFQFDIHAMIYSDEARTLEYELHKAFADKKVNMLNFRKEFFRVSLEEIESKIKELGFKAEFTSLPEAMEYKETIAILEKLRNGGVLSSQEAVITNDFPDSLD